MIILGIWLVGVVVVWWPTYVHLVKWLACGMEVEAGEYIGGAFLTTGACLVWPVALVIASVAFTSRWLWRGWWPSDERERTRQ